MSKLREKVIALKVNIEKNQKELDSIPRFNEDLWFGNFLIQLGAKDFTLGNIYMALIMC